MNTLLEKLRKSEEAIGAPAGLLVSQISAESGFNPRAVSEAGAQGLAQMLPSTVATWSGRVGRQLDPFNEDDAILLQQLTMRENYQRFGSWDDAVAAYHGGWDKARWGDKTKAYVAKVTGRDLPQSAVLAEYQKYRKPLDSYIPQGLDSGVDWIKAGDEMYRKLRDDAEAYDSILGGAGQVAKLGVVGGIGLTGAAFHAALAPSFPVVPGFVPDRNSIADYTEAEAEWALDSTSPEQFAYRRTEIEVRRAAVRESSRYGAAAGLLGGIAGDPLSLAIGMGSAGLRTAAGVGSKALANAGRVGTAVALSAAEQTVGSAIAVGIENAITGQVTPSEAWVTVVTGTLVGLSLEGALGEFRKTRGAPVPDGSTPGAEGSLVRAHAEAVRTAATGDSNPVVGVDAEVHTPDTVILPDLTTAVKQAVDDGAAIDSTAVVRRAGLEPSKDALAAVEDAVARAGGVVEAGIINPQADGAGRLAAIAATDDPARASALAVIAAREEFNALGNRLREAAQEVRSNARKARVEATALQRKAAATSEQRAKVSAATRLAATLEQRAAALEKAASDKALREARVAEEEYAAAQQRAKADAKAAGRAERAAARLAKARDAEARQRTRQLRVAEELQRKSDAEAVKRRAAEEAQAEAERAAAIAGAAEEATARAKARSEVLQGISARSKLNLREDAPHKVYIAEKDPTPDLLRQTEMVKILAATFLPDTRISVYRIPDARRATAVQGEAGMRIVNGEPEFLVRLPADDTDLHPVVHEMGHVVGYAVLHAGNKDAVASLVRAWREWRGSFMGDDLTLVEGRFAHVRIGSASRVKSLAKWLHDRPAYALDIHEVFAEQFVNYVERELNAVGLSLRDKALSVLRDVVNAVIRTIASTGWHVQTVGVAAFEILDNLLAQRLVIQGAFGEHKNLGWGTAAPKMVKVVPLESSPSGMGILGEEPVGFAEYNAPPWTLLHSTPGDPKDYGLDRLPHYDLATRNPSTFTPEEKQRAVHAAADIAAIKAKIVTINRAADPAGMWNQPDLGARIDGWVTRIPFLTSGAVEMLRSSSPVMRYAAWNLFEKTTTGGVPTAAMRQHLEYNKIMSSFVNEDNAAYRSWLTSNNVRMYDRAYDYLLGGNKLREEFNRLVMLERAERAAGAAPNRNVHPAVAAAVDKIGELSTRLRDSQVLNKTPGWEALGDSDPSTYVPQRLSHHKLLDATTEELDGLREVLRQQLATNALKQQTVVVNGVRKLVYQPLTGAPIMVPWDSAFINEFVDRYISRARKRAVGGYTTEFDLNAHGAISDINEILGEFTNLSSQERFVLRGLFAGAEAGHTKHRLPLDMTAQVPGTPKRLLDFYDTNYVGLLEHQARGVAADVGAVSVGIGGRAGIQAIRDLLTTPGSKEAGVTATAPELARFDQAVAELYGEPFGEVRSSAIDCAMLATSLVRMGGAAWNQMAEVVNVSSHLGIRTLLREVPAFNRLRNEAIALANGKPLPAGADPALRSVEKASGYDYGAQGYRVAIPWFERDSDIVPDHDLSTLQRVLRDGVDLMYKVNLFRAIHSVQQRFTAQQLNSKYIRHIAGDKAFSDTQRLYAMRAGMTEDLAARMRADPAWSSVVIRDGEVVNFDLTRFNPEVASEYAQALRRQVGTAIQEAFAGERAPYVHNVFGRAFMQFQNFAVLANEKQLKATLESHGWFHTAMTMMGHMLALSPVYMARVQANAVGLPEEEKEKYLRDALSPAKIALGALNMSAMPGLYTNFASIAAGSFGKFAKDTWAAPIVEPFVQPSSNAFVGGVGAPSVKMVNDWYRVFTPDGDAGVNWRDAARNAPFATLPLYRNLINQLPNESNE